MAAERAYLRKVRYAVQIAFLALTVYIGYRFYLFVTHFLDPSLPFVPRPPAVDAFLPIAGFMSFKYFIFNRMVEPMHPSAFFMFVSIVGVSFLLKKGFCGWICPVGTISQYLWMTGEKVLGRNFRIGNATDIGLRSLKYILMALFIFSIGIAMTTSMMVLFFISDYYKGVDVRMLIFFQHMSTLTLWVLIALALLSVLYKNFWCRYLCPYGALLGLVSSAGPTRIQRTDSNCIHCGTCSRKCPSLLDVQHKTLVHSPECVGCMTCVSSCPAKGALDMSVKIGKRRRALKPLLFPLVLLALFYLILGIGMTTGKWHSQIPYEEYQRIIPELYGQEPPPQDSLRNRPDD